jgi:hypothetical protein
MTAAPARTHLGRRAGAAPKRRFPTDPTTTRRGGKYARPHQIARRNFAARHHSDDPCVYCTQPLGPIGPWLHLDHGDHGEYRGFAHADCNRRAGAAKGGRVANANRNAANENDRAHRHGNTKQKPKTKSAKKFWPI